MAVTLTASGTTGQTQGGAESIMNAPNVAGGFQLHLDLNLMAAGDVIELRVYKMVKASGTSRVEDYLMLAGAQATDQQIWKSDIYYNTLTDANAVQFGIKQLFGTTRAFPYAIVNVEDFTAINVAQINGVSTSPVTTIKAVIGLAVDGVVTTVTNQLTAAAIATGIWQDTTAGDFTTALSIGKSIMNGVALGTGLKIAEVVLADTLTTYTGNTPQTGDAFARLGAPAGVSTAADIAAIKAETAEIDAVADQFVFTVANQVDANVITKTGFALTAAYDPAKTASQAGDAMALTAGERNSTSDALLARSMGTEGYAAKGAVPTVAQALFMLLQDMQERSISGTTYTIKKLDGSTTAMTLTLNDPTTPTAATRAT